MRCGSGLMLRLSQETSVSCVAQCDSKIPRTPKENLEKRTPNDMANPNNLTPSPSFSSHSSFNFSSKKQNWEFLYKVDYLNDYWMVNHSPQWIFSHFPVQVSVVIPIPHLKNLWIVKRSLFWFLSARTCHSLDIEFDQNRLKGQLEKLPCHQRLWSPFLDIFIMMDNSFVVFWVS